MMRVEQLTFPARASDPATSQESARKPRESQRMTILRQYEKGPLTDEEAAEWAGIRGGWKRCSELRAVGLIVPCGITVSLSTGARTRVCRITLEGVQALRG